MTDSNIRGLKEAFDYLLVSDSSENITFNQFKQSLTGLIPPEHLNQLSIPNDNSYVVFF